MPHAHLGSVVSSVCECVMHALQVAVMILACVQYLPKSCMEKVHIKFFYVKYILYKPDSMKSTFVV